MRNSSLHSLTNNSWDGIYKGSGATEKYRFIFEKELKRVYSAYLNPTLKNTAIKIKPETASYR